MDTLRIGNHRPASPPCRRQAQVLGAALATAILAAWSTGAARGEFREFTSPTGAKLVAELVASLGEGKLKIRKADGQEIVVNTSSFSDADQAYITEWIKTNPFAVNYQFDIATKEVKQESKTTDSTSERMTVEETAYEIAITNRARGTVDGVKVVYKAYLEDRVTPYGSHLSDPELLTVQGEAEIPPLEYNRTGRFLTKPHTVHRVRQKYGFYDRSNERDRMKGVWLRFYRGDTLVNEWRSEGVPVDQWDAKKSPSPAPDRPRDEAPEPPPASPLPLPGS
jgi:hypothetical protein